MRSMAGTSGSLRLCSLWGCLSSALSWYVSIVQATALRPRLTSSVVDARSASNANRRLSRVPCQHLPIDVRISFLWQIDSETLSVHPLGHTVRICCLLWTINSYLFSRSRRFLGGTFRIRHAFVLARSPQNIQDLARCGIQDESADSCPPTPGRCIILFFFFWFAINFNSCSNWCQVCCILGQ
jgi:hypothetical protein